MFRKAYTQALIDAIEDGDWYPISFGVGDGELTVTMYNTKGYVDFYVCTDYTADQVRQFHQTMIEIANNCLEYSDLPK